MPAGNASTRRTSAPTVVRDSTDARLPFSPRVLTRGERSRRLTHVFYSPRNHRSVTVTDVVNAAAAMWFEFDPSLVAYVERPRRLQFSPRQQIDIAFWTRSRSGEERFYLTIPDAGVIGSTSGLVSIRDPAVVADVACRHEIQLHTLSEAYLRSQSTWLRTCHELLLHVWEYQRQPVRSVIRAHIEAFMDKGPRVSLSTLLRTLDYSETAIKAVVAAMVHEGSVQMVEYTPGMIDAVLEANNA